MPYSVYVAQAMPTLIIPTERKNKTVFTIFHKTQNETKSQQFQEHIRTYFLFVLVKLVLSEIVSFLIKMFIM